MAAERQLRSCGSYQQHSPLGTQAAAESYLALCDAAESRVRVSPRLPQLPPPRCRGINPTLVKPGICPTVWPAYCTAYDDHSVAFLWCNTRQHIEYMLWYVSRRSAVLFLAVQMLVPLPIRQGQFGIDQSICTSLSFMLQEASTLPSLDIYTWRATLLQKRYQ